MERVPGRTVTGFRLGPTLNPQAPEAGHGDAVVEAVRVSPGPLIGRARAPASKSYTHRLLFLALLAPGETVLESPLRSDDTEATMNAVAGLGAVLRWEDTALIVEGPGADELRWSPCIDARESGTTLRLAMGVAALLDKPVLLHGRGRLHERPVGPLARSLGLLGVEAVVSRGCCPPAALRGPPRRSWTSVDASLSSQFLSALLLLGAGMGWLEIHVAALESRPYVEMTIKSLEAFRVRAERDNDTVSVKGRPVATRLSVPGDWSSAAALLAAAAAAGGSIAVAGLDSRDPHPDRSIVELLSSMGARCGVRSGEAVCSSPGPGGLEAVETCISDSPDLAPYVAAAAAVACGVSRICCAERLRLKESDRAAAIVDIVNTAGGEARLSQEPGRGLCIEIRGACGPLPGGGRISSHGDHRIAMAAAALCLASRRGCVVEQPGVVAKSYPGFWRDLERLGARLAAARAG